MTAGFSYLRMADSTSPAALQGLDMDAFAGYDNGAWSDFPAIAVAHPSSFLLDFTVFFRNLGTGGDFEPGDMDPSEAVPWEAERAQAGVWRPVLYASIAGYMVPIAQNLAAASLPRDSYRLLSAHYGWDGQIPGLEVSQHICGPSTCGSPIQCDGTQWIDHGSWDESLLLPSFFGTPPPTPPPPPVVYPGDNMKATPVNVAVAGGKGWFSSPVPAATIVSVAFETENPDKVGRYDSVPAAWSIATQPGPHSPNGAVMVEGMVPDGVYGAVVWSAA